MLTLLDEIKPRGTVADARIRLRNEFHARADLCPEVSSNQIVQVVSVATEGMSYFPSGSGGPGWSFTELVDPVD